MDMSQEADNLDQMYHAWLGKMTLGLSPAAYLLAYLDWLVHLSISPGKQGKLIQKAIRKTMRCSTYATHATANSKTSPCMEPLPQDNRFRGASWQQWPYNIFYQAFLHTQQWWYNATTGLHGVSPQHERVVEFTTRQILDAFSPSNSLLTNPEVLKTSLEQGGQNLIRGMQNFIDDMERNIGGKPPLGTENFIPGQEVAITPGKVIFRNRLIELIQYTPSTKTVYKESILITPAWIMKYYILDLSPHNSMVKYLVDKGHTVYMISWKNPDSEDRDLSMDDYYRLGVMASMDVITKIHSSVKIHTLGYCLGGTLLSIAAAAMARDGDERIKSITLLATQTEFTEVGELGLFIDNSQIAWLEDTMWEQGYLDTSQMTGAFSMLHSNDLIWSTMIHDYLLGERRPMIDLMAWNADATRLPYRMHSEYLERLYLNNDLAEGHYHVGEHTVSINDIRAPMFVVGTSKDHVAPWRSVFKIHQLAEETEVTFLLTNGGHNAGIISEPGHPHRNYQMATRKISDKHVEADTWLQNAPEQEGSWWSAWESWLASHSTKRKVSPPSVGVDDKDYPILCDAPGTYVHQK